MTEAKPVELGDKVRHESDSHAEREWTVVHVGHDFGGPIFLLEYLSTDKRVAFWARPDEIQLSNSG